jgi:hypothetical protein
MLRTRNAARVALGTLLLVVAFLAGSVSRVSADDRLGGHFGFVIPLVTRSDGTTTTVGDDFKIGFPTGITVKKTDKVAFDFELVPVIHHAPLSVSLTVHPGVIFGLQHSLAAGLRMAFDVKEASWGFTPLLARSFPVNGGACALFAELDVPIRFQQTAAGRNITAVTIAAHVGVGF